MKNSFVIACWVLVLAAGPLWARGGGGCFEKGTPILTPAGSVAIEKLRTGTTVWTVQNDRLAPATVLAVVEVKPVEYLELVVAGRSLRVTGEHPFQIAPGTFRAAEYLRAGDKLWVWDDRALLAAPLQAVHRVKASLPAYNLLVSPGGTFLAAGVLVHNKGCFLPDTLILRADGSQAAISCIQPGEEVRALKPDGSSVSAKVRAVLVHEVDEYVIVSTEKVILRVTREHPFYVGSGTCRTLAALHVGDSVYAFDGASLSAQPIVALERVQARMRVYNLQTDAPHTFFANGVAVHNKGGGGCFPAGTQVQTPTGPVPIQELLPGASVLAVRKNGTTMLAKVAALEASRSRVLILETDAGALTTTAEHPLAVAGGRFRPAGCLKPGDRILAWKGGQLRPATILTIHPSGEGQVVFNLRVGPPHTFIAGGFVVHNKGGGGGGFRSSGGFHSSGGRSHGAGSPSRAGNMIFWTTIVVVLVVLVVLIAVAKKNKKDEDLDFVYDQAAVRRKADKTEKMLTFLATQDSSMAPAALHQLVTSSFLKLQECWQAREYSPMKPLLMPDLYEEHSAQLRGMIRNHEINKLENVAVERIDLVHLRYTHKADNREFTALITARARDYYVDDRTQAFLRGDRSPARFQEFWTFQLQGGVWCLRQIEQSRESDVLQEENFVEMFTDKQVQDIYKESKSAGGPAGPWLEKEVGQKANRVERLLNFLVETDKIWNRKLMIERARQVFLDVFLAEETGNPDAVKTDELFPEAAAAFQAEIRRRQNQGSSVEYRNLCVRKVELILVRNFSDNNLDEYTVRIGAHAQKIVKRNGRILSQDEYVTPFEQYWTFGRLDRQWKLKEILPPAAGQARLAQENLDQDVDPSMLQWYYTKSRTG